MTDEAPIAIGELRAWAHHYTEHGLDVFPVNPRDKTPLVSQYDATTDRDAIEHWWQRWPTALIGHRLPADHIILDIDPRHGGFDTWQALKKQHGDPQIVTRYHASGRGDGGGHLWFLRPDDQLTINALDQWARDHHVGHTVLGKDGAQTARWTGGIDILQHTHRYTILPPSPHPDTGEPYRWVYDLTIPPGVMPGWLADLLTDTAPAAPPKPPPGPRQDDSIADWYTDNHPFSTLLPAYGWTLRAGNGDEDGSRWRHPSATSAFSATIRHSYLFCYSPNTPLEPTAPGDPHGYTPFAVYAAYEHAGDLSAAARAARLLKEPDERTHTELIHDIIGPPPAGVDPDTGEILEQPDVAPSDEPVSTLDLLRSYILTGHAVESIPPPEPLIDDWLDLESLAVLYGRPGGGKSFLAIDYALHVATGSWWQGHETVAGNVLYVAAEGRRGLGIRQRAWRLHNRHHNPVDRIHWLPRAVNLLDPVYAAALIQIADDLRPQLVVIDTLARSMVGGDENAGKDMGRVIEAADTIKHRTGACILIVHHSGKDQTAGARGHSSLLGAVDTELELKNGGDGIITLANTKQKESGEQPPMRLRLAPAGDSVAIAPYRGGITLADDLTPKAMVTLDSLIAIATPEGVHVATWRDHSVQNGTGRSAFYEHRKVLLERGLVRNIGTDTTPRYVPSEQGEQ